MYVMESQLQDNLKSVIVKIGLHLSYPLICCTFLGLITARNLLTCDVTVRGRTDQGTIAVQLEEVDRILMTWQRY